MPFIHCASDIAIPPIPPSTRPPTTRISMAEALKAAMRSELPYHHSEGLITPPLSRPASPSPYTTLHSNSSSLSLSASWSVDTPSDRPPSRCISEPDLSPRVESNTESPKLSGTISTSAISTPPDEEQPTKAPFALGNLFLSSCPGKKVRLDGPVRGRSGVCRDLGVDLRRMKELGVGCIICCLDDTELEFLGSPWTEYKAATEELQIDVLRLPTPEGLSPTLSPAILNDHLSAVFKDYTLRGIPVLVHCRGGVGRAGVVACCWILKLGLCGWFDLEQQAASTKSHWESLPNDDLVSFPLPVRPDTMRLVETVINLVRRRRSIKAIETYEQVKFLVDFIEYLRSQPS